MAIVFTDETALDYWRWRASVNSILDRPVPCRITSLPSCAPSPSEALMAAESFHRGFAPLQLLVPSGREKRNCSDVRYSYYSKDFPAGSLYKISAGTYVVSPELVFVRLGRKLDLLALVELGFEMTGNYFTCVDDTRGFAKASPVTTQKKILNYAQRSAGRKGAKKAARSAKYICPNSNSPRETELAMLLSLPKKLGGYGLPKPSMNHCIYLDPTGSKVPAFNKYNEVDLYWEKHGIGIEYESDEFHHGEDKFVQDSMRRNLLNTLGHNITTLTNKEFKSIARMDAFAERIRKDMRLRKTVDPSSYQFRKLKLKTTLEDIRRNKILGFHQDPEPATGFWD